nr:MAG TPA: hypothetical protein [Caudoviricetes sp.]DAI94572.1 MAG TPA: hypothetical protein [Caudoviricetes sp.]
MYIGEPFSWKPAAFEGSNDFCSYGEPKEGAE